MRKFGVLGAFVFALLVASSPVAASDSCVAVYRWRSIVTEAPQPYRARVQWKHALQRLVADELVRVSDGPQRESWLVAAVALRGVISHRHVNHIRSVTFADCDR